MDINENVLRLENLLKSTNREGIDKLLAYIQKSDFYTAPASTQYHSCHDGGLLEHSLNVYNRLKKKLEDELWVEKTAATRENVIITALLHDLCKMNFYIKEPKNKKVYKPDGSKKDDFGRYDWETVEGYKVDDKIPLGHGSKSALIAQQFIKLEQNELYGILHHMGFTEGKETYNTVGNAIKKCPFVLAVHEADLEATYLLEEEE